jgi:hypothetical protein
MGNMCSEEHIPVKIETESPLHWERHFWKAIQLNSSICFPLLIYLKSRWAASIGLGVAVGDLTRRFRYAKRRPEIG